MTNRIDGVEPHKPGEGTKQNKQGAEFPDPFSQEFPLASAPAGLEIIEDVGEALDLPAEDIFQAFSRFMQIRIAQGDATDDTIRAYYREIDFWVQWCARHNVDPAQARRSHIEMYREELKQQGLRVNTRSHKLSIIRRFYDAAVEAGLRDNNPAASVRGGKDQTPGEEKIKSLTAAALARLLDSVPTDTLVGKRDRAIIALMAIHGLRRVEVERMDEKSVLFQEDLVSIEVRGKANRLRQVYLRPDTYRALADYIVSKHRAGFAADGPCFVSFSNRSKGERISRRSLNEIVDHYLSAASLKRGGVSCHALRHTFGTLSVRGGAKIEDIKDAMGHVEIESTELYARAVARVENNPANFIDVEA